MRFLLAAAFVVITAATAQTQAPGDPYEYELKAAYLYNFVKFIEWPAATRAGALTICTAGADPFAGSLDQIVRGDTVNGRPIATRTIPSPQTGCDVVFVPRGVAPGEFLRATRTAPVLTVGESPDFIAQGGIINFVRDAGTVRFEIDQGAARRANLQISSRLLRLAREPQRRAQP